MTYRTGSDLEAIRQLVRGRASNQGGVFRRVDLTAWGVEPTVVVTMVRNRLWARLHHGVYTDAQEFTEADPIRQHILRCAAAVVAVDRPAFVFGASAAAVHGLPLPRSLPAAVEIIRPLDTDGRAFSRRVTARDHLEEAAVRTHHLSESDTTRIDGVPVVTRDIAAISAAAHCDEEWALAVLDAAAWQDPSAPARLAARVAEYGHLRGIGTVRSVLPAVRTGAQTALESFSRARLTAQGLPEPELQVALHDAEGLIGYVDALWRPLGVVGEADGRLKYDGGTDVVVAEKRREDRIRALGYAVVRWTWREIMTEPQVVARRIRSASQWSARRAG